MIAESFILLALQQLESYDDIVGLSYVPKESHHHHRKEDNRLAFHKLTLQMSTYQNNNQTMLHDSFVRWLLNVIRVHLLVFFHTYQVFYITSNGY